MTVTVLAFGAIVVSARYIERRKNCWYFRRRIPADLQKFYPNDPKGVLFHSLQTSCEKEASRRAHKIAIEQDAQWEVWRTGSQASTEDIRRSGEGLLRRFGLEAGDGNVATGDEPNVSAFVDHLRYHSDPLLLDEALEGGVLPPVEEHAARLFYDRPAAPTLTEAVHLYQELTGVDRTAKDKKARQATAKKVASIIGDLPVDQYRRADANRLVRALLDEGLKTNTVRRYINYISPVVKQILLELEIPKRSPFENVRIANYGHDVSKRAVFEVDELRMVQEKCLELDDDMRWLIALISDTGMRLNEAVGLPLHDIHLDAEIPYIEVRPTAERRLKTPQSERTIPLVGASLWAARRLHDAKISGVVAFPRYWRGGEPKATSASNALAKFLRSLGLPKGKTIHSLRHTLRDRLREVGTEEEVVDRIGGWSSGNSVGRGYGAGHSLRFLHTEMLKIVLVEA